MPRKRWIAIGAVVVAAAGLAIGLSLALTGGGGGAPKKLSHADYELLWDDTHLGEPKQAVLARWPKVPDQHYTDNLKDDCYEWDDVPVARLNNLPANLYNLCFKDGVLRMKVLG